MKSLGQAYAVVGNHDTSPVNSFPPAAVDTTMTSQWAFDVMSSEWNSVSAKNNFASKFNQCCNSFWLLIDLSFHAFLTLSLSPKEQILKVSVSSGLEAPLLNKRIQTLALTQFWLLRVFELSVSTPTIGTKYVGSVFLLVIL